MKRLLEALRKESVRAYIYRVSLAVIPLLTAYGLLADETAALIVGLAGAVFNAGLATANTSTETDS